MVLLRSEIPSGMCAKLRTVAASSNRDHARNLSSRTLVIVVNRSHVNIGRATTSQSLLLVLARAAHIMVLFFPHIPFVVNHTINATPPERLQQYFVSTTVIYLFGLFTFRFAFTRVVRLVEGHSLTGHQFRSTGRINAMTVINTVCI